MTKSTASAASNRSPSPDTDSARCKAIAISTGQRCTRSGKLDGYCTEKHKQQADSTNGLWGMAARPPGASPFTDSEGETHPVPADASKKSKTSKALKALGIKKSADAKDTAAFTQTPTPGPAPAPAPARAPSPAAASPKAPKATKASKSPATVNRKTPTPRRTAATPKNARSKKQDIESSDEFEPESDNDYEPSDSDDNEDSDSDDDTDEDDDIDELSGKLASVKIKPDDPTLPPRPNDGSVSKLKSKIKRTKSKIFNTDAVLAPPKNKTKSSSKSGHPTGGFWVPAPPPVKIPESTMRVLASVKDRLKLQDSSSDTVPTGHHGALEKKPSGFFKYRARVHDYLFTNDEDSEVDSKRAGMKKMLGEIRSFYHKVKGSSDSDTGSGYQKPLPQVPAGKSSGATPKHKSSGDSVESITQDVKDLSVKSEDDEVPNQCHGFNTNGHRCKRRVKLDRPMEKGEVLMCHDHEVNEDDEVVVHIEGKGGVLLQWMDLSAWVNPGLPDYVQNKLRKAIERPVSDTDKPGYIYAYQLVETRLTNTHTLFKVGRTDNVFRRMSEWSDKCGSPPRLLEVFPEQGSLAPRDENDLAENATKIAGDNEVTGLRCRYAHRVERLIHIELKPFHDKDHVCACKTKHQEWFKVPHQPGLSDSQQMKQAWAQVRRVVVHWMAYMEHVYGPG